MKVTQTMKYKIEFGKDLYKLLDDISYAIWKVKIKATTMAYDWQQFSFGYNERYGDYPKDKEVMGKGHMADANSETKKLATFINSTIVDAATQNACKKVKELSIDIAKGNKSIPTYRRDGSFPMRAQAIKNLSKINSSKYTVKLSLLSREGAKERNTKGQQLVILKTGKGAYEILDRILDGTYKMCDSEIVKRKNKYYLMLTYQFEKELGNKLIENKIMGIDMGVAKPVYIAFNDSLKRASIDGDEITHFRKSVQTRRNSMLRQGKYCGEGRRGHGRATRIKPIEKLQGKVENFKNTTNHKYAKYVVDTAIKNKCGTIQMEDLSGIASDEKKGTFLGDWTYYDLQQKIEYKAKREGIKVVKVNPAFTSARCSKCGYIHKGVDKKLWRPTQEQFICQNCGFKANADYNAAKNISIPGIDDEIKRQLDAQEKHKKHVKKYII
ncbi:MAG: RNA-guided endonuclease TnpB family protein [Bacillaceae bacterium]